MFEDYKKRIPQVIFENPDELISGGEHQKLLLDGVDLVEAELNKKADSKDVKTELDKKVDNTSFDTYKKEQELVNDSKVDKENYNQDLDAVNDKINASDAGVSENKQELNGIKKLLSEAAYSSKVVGTAKGGGVITFPSNVLTNASPRYRINGLTLNQLVKNGDFNKGVDGWSRNMSETKIKDGWCGIIVNQKGAYNGIYSKDTINIEKGHRYYCSIRVRCSHDNLKFTIGMGNSSKAFTIGLGEHRLSYIGKSQGASTCIVYCDTAASDDFKSGDMFELKDYMIVDCNHMGDDEGLVDVLNSSVGNYFEGFKSSPHSFRLHSISSNVWDVRGAIDGELTYSKTILGEECLCWRNGAKFNDTYLFKGKVKKNTQYTISGKGYVTTAGVNWLNFAIYYTDGTKKTSGFAVNKERFTDFLITTEKGKTLKYLKPIFANNEECAMVVDGLAIYETASNSPYADSCMYINTAGARLGSVGSSYDHIENGKLYQNIKRHYFSKEDEWTLREDYEGDNFRYYMTLPFDYKATGAGVENELLCNNFTPTSNVESVLTERESGTIALYKENASTIYLTLDKKVSDVNSVIPEGTFIDVILPKTEVTNLDTSGMVVARPNGTVFIEPVANLTAFYNNGLDVSTLTIEEVESFSTFKDGNYQELDVSKVSIKDGKLTHPNAVNGLCYLVYRHDNAPIYGNNEVDYYNSEKTLKSPNGKVWKKIEEATDEGELVTKLEEVK